MRKYITPQRIIAAENTENAEYLLGSGIMQAVFNTDGCALIKDGGYVLLDFGAELCGGITVVTQTVSEENTKYRIVFGESTGEAMSRIGEKNSGNNHSVRDMTVDAVFMSTQTFGETGFRFVRLEAVGGDITVRAAKAAPDIRDIEYRGAFSCDDELLNEIWKVGAYTVQLNMHEYLWDGAKRDRLVWVGDMHPETSTIAAVFGDDECVKNSLELVKRETPRGKWMNFMPTYSLWWIIIQYDRYMHWGDLDYLMQQKDYMAELSDMLTEWIDSGFYSENSDSLFVDWSSAGQDGREEGVRSIACMALECLKKIFAIYDENARAAKCGDYRRELQRVKPDDGGELNNRLAALTVLAGRGTEKISARVLSTTADEMSCFMGYYILKALAKLGGRERALELIREYWGGMLKLGATTFWEEFKPEWAENAARIDELVPEGKSDIHGDFGEHCYRQYRLSLCHGWASGPTAFLSEQIGGIEILEPGCRKLRISPELSGLEHIDIKYPTPYGCVRIKSRRENGEVKTEISAPDGVEIVK